MTTEYRPVPKLELSPSRQRARNAELTKPWRNKRKDTIAQLATTPADKPLTPQQLAFARFWAEGESANSAAARAGYAHAAVYAHRLTHMPNIRRAYDEIKKKYEEAAQMTREKVMAMHQEAFDMAKLMSEPSSMVSAAREIGKMCGYYEPVKVRVDVNVEGRIMMDRMKQLSDEELLKIIAENAEQAAQALIESEAGEE